MQTHEYIKRMHLKKCRAALRQREASKDTTYETNCSFFNQPVVEHVSIEGGICKSINLEESLNLYLGLETSGFERECSILQIAAKWRDHQFNEYILRTKEISQSATDVHGLRI